MKRLIAIALIMATGCAFAADIRLSGKLWEQPLISTIRDTARLYVYDNLSGNRNITGANFRLQAIGGDGPLIKQAHSSYSSINPNTPNSVNRRVSEIRNRAGIITQYITAAGLMVLGTPRPLAVNSVAPVHGTTNLFNNYSVRKCAFTTCSTMTGVYWNGKKMTTPVYVQYNKGAAVTTAQQYINGVTLGFDTGRSTPGQVQFLPFSTAAGTTYTVRVLRQSILQTDGEWTSSCGSNMIDNAGVCESTFSTR